MHIPRFVAGYRYSRLPSADVTEVDGCGFDLEGGAGAASVTRGARMKEPRTK